MDIGIVTNSRATRNRKDPDRIMRLGNILSNKGLLRIAADYEETVAIAKEFRERGIKVLGIDGGDGTLHYTLTAFVEVYKANELPHVVHLKGGAMNTIAKSVGIRGNSEKILKDVIEGCEHPEDFDVAEVNLLRVNRRYGFIFGTGFAVNFLELYYEGDDAGPPQAIRAVLRTAYSLLGHTECGHWLFYPTTAQVVVDGKPLPWGEYTFLLGYTVRQVGLGFKPGYALPQEGKYFRFLGSALGGHELLYRFPKLYLGMPSRNPKFWEQGAREVLIRWERPQKYTIDGEIFNDCRELRVELGPRIKFIRGKRR